MAEITRRSFLTRTTMAAGAVALADSRVLAAQDGSKKLRMGVVGVAGRGGGNLAGVQSENLVALCDIDKGRLEGALKRMRPKHAGVTGYADFRDMIAKEQLDCLVVSTADHTHAVISAAGLHAGLDVYCEKPLAHTVHESRVLTDLAAKKGAITQMGTQIHSGKNYRRVVEHIESQVIGPVKDVHVFCNKTWSGGDRAAGALPIPKGLSWDLWLGPAPARAYNKGYHPGSWRRFWDFGGGTLGDMACHYMDLPFWALDLKYPETVQSDGPRIHAETTPPDLCVKYHFGPRGDLPGVDLTWYDGKRSPAILKELGLEAWKNGVLFVGTKGWLISDYGRMQVGPNSRFEGYKPPHPYIANSIGHHREWLEACKKRGPTTCPFSYSGPLSEAVLLGNVSYRLAGKKLEWDPTELRAANCPEAEGFIRKRFREGWTL